MPLCVDYEWLRIDDEENTDGERTVPLRGRMVRAQGGGMVVGRIVNDIPNNQYLAQKWRVGKFVEIGTSKSIEAALKLIEEVRP